MRRHRILGHWIRGAVLLAAALGGSAGGTRAAGQTAAASQVPVTTTADGFAVPQAGRRFVFPRDHGNHPDFRIEW